MLHVQPPDTNTCKSICKTQVATLKKWGQLSHTHTQTQTLGRLEATRVTQFSMVDSIELRTEVGQGQEAAHVAQLVAAGNGQRAEAEAVGNSLWVCLLSQIVCRLH